MSKHDKISFNSTSRSITNISIGITQTAEQSIIGWNDPVVGELAYKLRPIIPPRTPFKITRIMESTAQSPMAEISVVLNNLFVTIYAELTHVERAINGDENIAKIDFSILI